MVLIILILCICILLMIAVGVKLIYHTESVKKELRGSCQKLEQSYEKEVDSKKELSLKFEELKHMEEKNHRLAYTDYLTELPNRIAFNEMLENTLLTLRLEETIAIMYIDLDNFKNINDSLGHSYGDELIIDVSYRLKEAMDENDYLSRFGGDEFIILSQNLSETVSFEEKVRRVQKVFSYPFVLAMKEFFITVSIGITYAPKDGKDEQVLLKNVDAAMYAAKELGKNTYCFYDETINNKLLEKLELQSELRKAIEREEFELYYQAQIDLVTDRVAGFEALVRWHHPKKGIIAPAEFIPVAEETGLIISMGKWILHKACLQLKEWQEYTCSDITMAVNLSARQFKDENLAETVSEILRETEIIPGRLELEITESVALEDLEYSIQTIHKLKEMGIKFALDDFGTGYSSMSYLKKLPVENLKIDKSFLDTVTEDEKDQKIVSTIIKLAQILDLKVIAEGIELEEQAVFLKKVNCNKAQGYLYSMPVPEEEAKKLMIKKGRSRKNQ